MLGAQDDNVGKAVILTERSDEGSPSVGRDLY